MEKVEACGEQVCEFSVGTVEGMVLSWYSWGAGLEWVQGCELVERVQ